MRMDAVVPAGLGRIKPSSGGGLEQESPTPFAIMFRGGCNTVAEPSCLPMGACSWIQNFRNREPYGIIQRGGQAVLHSTPANGAATTDRILSVYQHRKGGKYDEKHLYAQLSDGDVHQATAEPPAVTAGVFGTEVFAGGTSGLKPASWADIQDLMVHSNFSDQHQIYAGDGLYVSRFLKYDSNAAPGRLPENGWDYSRDVSDGKSTTVAILDSLNTYASDECLFIGTPVPANELTWTIGAVNGTVSVVTLYYRKNDGTWADASATDNTASGGATLATTGGAMTWSHPSDEIPCFLFGETLFWYQLRFSVQLDAEVEVSGVQYSCDFQDLPNIWCGIAQHASEVIVYDSANSVWKTYHGTGVDLSDAAATADSFYVYSPYKLEGIYADVSNTPNLTTTTILLPYYWDGDSWAAAGNPDDGTSGLTQSGWILFDREAAEPRSLNSSDGVGRKTDALCLFGYWYKVTIGDTDDDDDISADCYVSVKTMPYFDMDDFGAIGGTCCAWKDRLALTFDDHYVYVSAKGQPTVFNGPDFGIVPVGDGRKNEVLCQRRFGNELMVGQEELGTDGGCTTLIQGTYPLDYGCLRISTKIGCLNSQSIVIVEGTEISTRTEEKIKRMAYILSHYGVMACDGKSMDPISDKIQNYFNPRKTECIRRGYEDRMWIAFDSAEKILRLGLVTGTPRVSGADTAGTASKLTYATGGLSAAKVGDTVKNTTDSTEASVTAVDSDTVLSLDSDIMDTGESFQLVPGVPNVFPVYCLITKEWIFDELGHPLSCFAEVEAGSDEIPVLQVGGGVDDGTVYLLNTGTNDVSTAIDAYLDIEIQKFGVKLETREVIPRMKPQAAGDLTIKCYENSVENTDQQKTLSMTVVTTGDDVRRHREDLNLQAERLTLRLQNNTASQELYLLDMALTMYQHQVW